MVKSACKVFLAVIAFGALHSLLASREAKELAVERMSKRERNAFYRPFYILQSFASVGALLWYILPLPDRVIYRVRGLPALLMRLGQAAGLAYATWTAYEIGLLRVSGAANLFAWLRGERVIPAEPEAQGPSVQDNRLKVSGPFRIQRHPLNFSPLPVFWLNPVMTVKLLAFNLAASIYLYLGSFHEEQRLLAAYGERYRRYQRSRVPFYFPRVKQIS